MPGSFVQDEIFDNDASSTDDRKHANGSYTLTEVSDANVVEKYFENNDTELLEAMKKYELDIDIKPEWFDDWDEIETGEPTKQANTSSGSDGKSCHCTNASEERNETKTAFLESGENDFEYYQNYIDPAWFDEEFE